MQFMHQSPQSPFGPAFFSPLPDGLASLLHSTRRVSLSGEISEERAPLVIAELVLLAAQQPDQHIELLINSIGGATRPSLAIYDAMTTVACPVATLGTGLVAGTAVLILAAGARGRRFALPSASLRLGLPRDAAIDQRGALDARLEALHRDRERFVQALAQACGQRPERIAADLEQQRVFTATEAVEYGLVDHQGSLPR